MSADDLARLSDLRVVRLVQNVEEALESYSRSLLDALPEGPVRDAASGVLSEGAAHRALHAVVAEHDAALAEVAAAADPADVVQAMRDTERFAHDFYLSLLDRLHDSELVVLVRDLVTEESGHVRSLDRADAVMDAVARGAAP